MVILLVCNPLFLLRISDISNLLGQDWVKLAKTLDIADQDINLIISEYPDNVGQQAMVMLRLWLNTEGNKATGNALEIALKNCDREDIVDKCMFNVKMVTDDSEQEEAHNTLKMYNEFGAFTEENNVNTNTSKPLTRDYSIDVNVDENDYKENHFSAGEQRLGGIREEGFARHEESTSDYEREEQKYVAEEKEFASSYQQEQTTMETREFDKMIITEKSETKSDYLHEEMKKMSVEESQTTTYHPDGDSLVQMTSESRKEEEHQEREMFREERSEQKQTQIEEKEDGAVLILSDSRKESKQQFAAETQETKHHEESAVIRGREDFDS